METPSNMYKFSKALATEEEYRLMADNLLTYVQKKETLDINDFPLSLSINPKDFAGFSHQDPYFATAYDTALYIIASRLKRLAHEGKIDRIFALELLPLYDGSYRQLLKEKRQKEHDQDFMETVDRYVSARSIILKELPVSTAVPDKKSSNKMKVT